MITRALKLHWMVAILTTCMAACGGGSSAPATGAGGGGNTGGITRTGAVVGVGSVTGFGSVIVNGVEYDTAAATFTIDGNAGTQDDLAVGDIVIIKGSIDDDNTNAVAESVEYDDSVEGPIAAGSIDTATGSFVVLGQRVIADALTSFDDSISPASLDGLADDDVVEISGHVKADGSIHATRIESKSAGGEFEITGTVTDTPTPTTFEIGDLTVDFSNVMMLRNFPGGRPVEIGDLVEAKGNLVGPNLLEATSVEFKGDRLAGDDGDHVEVQGFITSFVSLTNFEVSNETMVSCDTDANCTVTTEGAPGGSPAVNTKVEVKGEYDNGVLVATSVDIRLGNAVRVTATVDSFDDRPTSASDEGSLVMLGITFTVDGGARTRFEDKSGQASEFSDISQIQPGDYLEVRGGLDGDGNLFAVIVELEELEADVVLAEVDTIIQGFLQADPAAEDFPPLSILDVIIESNSATVFENENDDEIDPAVFFGMIQAGSLIKAKGTNVSQSTATPPVFTLTAEEMEIQME